MGRSTKNKWILFTKKTWNDAGEQWEFETKREALAMQYGPLLHLGSYNWIYNVKDLQNAVEFFTH